MHDAVGKHISDGCDNKVGCCTVFVLLLEGGEFERQVGVQTDGGHCVRESRRALNSATDATDGQRFDFSPDPQTISVFPLYIDPEIPVTLSRSRYPYLRPRKMHNSGLVLPSEQYSVCSPSTTISHSHSF